MDRQNPFDSDALLDQALAALRDAPILDSPPPQVTALTVEAAERESQVIPLTRRIIMAAWNVRYRELAAAILVFAVIGWFFVETTRTRLAFADVQEKVRAARSIRFKRVFKFEGQPEEIKAYLVIAGRQRVEEADGSEITILVNGPERVDSLTLYPATKRAVRDSTVHKGIPPLDVLAWLQDEPETWAPRDKEEVLDGRETIVYRKENITVWVDPQSHLPVQIKMVRPSHDLQGGGHQSGLTQIWRDFEWNVEADDSLFSLEPPRGYTLVENEPMDLSDPTEQDLIEALRLWTDASGGKFPRKEDISGFMQSHIFEMMQKAGLLPKDKKFDELLKDERNRSIHLQVARGGLFRAQLVGRKLWNYSGEGVKLGEADKVVAWWKATKDAPMYRVLYGDLTIKDVKPEDLPKASP